jgi:hypothetical protein
MTAELRWRVLTLQGILVVVLAGAAAFLFWSSALVNGMIHDQLSAQKIYFPPKTEIRAGGALDPKEFPPEIQLYAGQQVDSGDKARVFANDFIGMHLKTIAGGRTYSQVSADAQANPSNAKLQAQRSTLFQGETLRALLLNAWGWSQVGTYALWGGIVMGLGALAALAAFLFELLLANPATARQVRERTRRPEIA